MSKGRCKMHWFSEFRIRVTGPVEVEVEEPEKPPEKKKRKRWRKKLLLETEEDQVKDEKVALDEKGRE